MSDIKPLEAAMSRVMIKAEAMMKKWEEFCTIHTPDLQQSAFGDRPHCPTHQHIKLDLDLNESLERSFGNADIENGSYTLVWKPCHKCLVIDKKKKANEKWIRRGIPTKCMDATLKGMVITGPDIEGARQQVADWVMKDLMPPFLFLCGQPGRGKSHMAAAVLKNHGSGWFVRHSDLLNLHRSRINDPQAVDAIEKGKHASLLVIDEFGVALSGKDELDMFYAILGYRFDNDLPTIITSNYDYVEINDYINYPALMSRLTSASIRIWVDGPDFRTWKGEDS